MQRGPKLRYNNLMSELPERPIFELRRLPEKTDEALLTELRRVAALIQGQALTVEIFRKHGRVSRKIYNKRFGGWIEALNAAGLAYQSSDVVPTRGATPSRKLSDAEVLGMLSELARRLGVSELTSAHVEKHLPFTTHVLRTRWGTTQAAFEAAGLNPSLLGRRYTDEECYRNLLNIWTYYGRPPKYLEMGMPPSEVGGKAYMRRFSTWNKALAAFVERVNAEPVPAPTTADSANPAPERPPAERPMSVGEETRGIPLGLRFRILHRDRFKCVLCGDHPARNADCRLHIDHILPWSKSGKTREDNLRTLCAKCNVGRGNRFLD